MRRAVEGRGTRKSWRRRLRQHLDVSEQGGRLVLRRRWQPHAFGLGVYGLSVTAALCLTLAAPMVNLHQHFLWGNPNYALFLRLLYALVLIVPVVYARRVSLRRHTFVFDRAGDYVTRDDRVVCALSEVQSVRVGSPLGRESDMKELGFLIHGRNEVPIEWDDFLGAGLEELGQSGQTLSLYAGIPLWTNGEWRDPTDPHASPPPAMAADPTRPISSTLRGGAREP